jgi:hypothetical protein
MLFGNKNLSPIQRRSGVLFGSFLILTMVVFAALHLTAEDTAIPSTLLHLLELLPAIPVAAMIFIVGRYLNRETDEFVRMLVTQSILWGLGVTMVGDIVFGVVFEDFHTHGLSQVYNIDVFCITALIALRVQLWRNQ